MDPELSSDSEDELDHTAVSKGKHDLLVKNEAKSHPGFFKSSKKQYPLFPFFEEKMKYDEYGELIRSVITRVSFKREKDCLRLDSLVKLYDCDLSL